MLLDHYLPYLFENSEQFNVDTHNAMFQGVVQLTEYSFMFFAPYIVIQLCNMNQ